MPRGGSARGVNLHLAPDELARAPAAEMVDVTVAEEPPGA
jgi:hypothetical protein